MREKDKGAAVYNLGDQLVATIKSVGLKYKGTVGRKMNVITQASHTSQSQYRPAHSLQKRPRQKRREGSEERRAAGSLSAMNKNKRDFNASLNETCKDFTVPTYYFTEVINNCLISRAITSYGVMFRPTSRQLCSRQAKKSLRVQVKFVTQRMLHYLDREVKRRDAWDKRNKGPKASSKCGHYQI